MATPIAQPRPPAQPASPSRIVPRGEYGSEALLRTDLDLRLASRRPACLMEVTLRAALDAPAPRARVLTNPPADGPAAGHLSQPTSIVVVTFNNLPYTKLCLASVLANTPYPGYELIVVDNASADPTRDFLRELAHINPHVRLILNDANRGFAGANNQAVSIATGDVLVLLNNDTIVPPRWLQGLLGHLDSDPSIGLIGPVTNRTCNEAQIETAYRTYGELETFAQERAAACAGKKTDLRMSAMFCTAMPRRVFLRVGPLDERFGMGLFEDDDYSKRVRDAGYRVSCAEDVFVHHFGEASFASLKGGEYAHLLVANRERFEKKWNVVWQPHPRRGGPRQDTERAAVRRAVEQGVPSGATVAVVSKGDEQLVTFDGRHGWHFPRAADGQYAGFYPADSAGAIEQLKSLRAAGADHLLLPVSAFWWLDYYREFAEHLERNYRRLPDDQDGCIIYALGAAANLASTQAPAQQPPTPTHAAPHTQPEDWPALPPDAGSAALYLDLVKRSLTNWIYGDAEVPPFDPWMRAEGRDWPPGAHTMVGMRRLNNLQRCAQAVLAAGIPGDFIETGVWRGGACILMRAVLKAHAVRDRRVWVADSFQGLPPPNAESYPSDAGDPHHTFTALAVSRDQVMGNFNRYGLLDEQVCFLEGWFRDTLPNAPIDRLALLRLDGDMYESTMDALVHLYPRLSPGGFLIVDDYGCCHNCRQAVDDYRKAHCITDEIHWIDWTGIYWRRSKAPSFLVQR